ncbi:hypothetical protein RRG08_015256 [Elysia crispata]|uniref:Uncharacterized protein n=1 Tax=Elysia crispata TaxID=231223 RepID=A0AAE1D7I7_9GAST|nr:hypothetical protein RRG08_015256 [Elysia crispata]
MLRQGLGVARGYGYPDYSAPSFRVQKRSERPNSIRCQRHVRCAKATLSISAHMCFALQRPVGVLQYLASPNTRRLKPPKTLGEATGLTFRTQHPPPPRFSRGGNLLNVQFLSKPLRAQFRDNTGFPFPSGKKNLRDKPPMKYSLRECFLGGFAGCSNSRWILLDGDMSNPLVVGVLTCRKQRKHGPLDQLWAGASRLLQILRSEGQPFQSFPFERRSRDPFRVFRFRSCKPPLEEFVVKPRPFGGVSGV